jgi:hypothetical protein
VIPMVGPIIAAIPVLLIAFFTVGLLKLIIVAVLYTVILIVQQNVLTPMVISRSVGVTPLVIFVALLSIPIAGIVRVAAERLFPPDPQTDAMLIRTRNRSGDPRGETRAATVTHPRK